LVVLLTLQNMGDDSKKLEREREAALRECEKLRAALKKLGYDDSTESDRLQVLLLAQLEVKRARA
jgi:hypothetical protein